MPKQQIDLQCPRCGSMCKWLDDESTKVCLHCGYQEKVTDSDSVARARIAANKELELARIKAAKEEADRKEFHAFMKGAAIFVAICFGLLFLMGALGVK
jgi:Zn ribbon nucleic-acid-binding protein